MTTPTERYAARLVRHLAQRRKKSLRETEELAIQAVRKAVFELRHAVDDRNIPKKEG
jgi:hypothetical protein